VLFISGYHLALGAVFMRVMRREITAVLITCWSCDSHDSGNASPAIKGLKQRVAGGCFDDRAKPHSRSIFPYCRDKSLVSAGDYLFSTETEAGNFNREMKC